MDMQNRRFLIYACIGIVPLILIDIAAFSYLPEGPAAFLCVPLGWVNCIVALCLSDRHA